ncbi:MAG: MFS transporter [Archaeoglobaceae archaeon]
MRISVERHDMQRSLKNFVLEGISSQITYSLITATVISSYLATIKAPPFVIGLVVAIPHLTTTAQLISAKFVEKRNRKKIAIVASFTAKLSLFAIALTSFINGETEVFLFSLFYLTFNVCEDIFTVTWSSWMRDLIPGGKRGELLSKRSAYGRIIATFFLFPQIWIFGILDKVAFSVLFLLSAIIGVFGVYFLSNIENAKSKRVSEAKLKDPLKNSNFLKLAILVSLFCFTLSSARTFFAVYLIEVLFYPLWAVVMLMFIAHLSSIYSFRIAGTFSDRVGNKPLLSTSFIVFSISAIFFAISNPQTGILPLLIAYLLHGFYTSAPTIAFMNAVADLTHKKHSAPFFAFGNWLQDVFSAMGCVFAGFIISALYYTSFSYQILFLISSFISISLLPFLRFYDEFSMPTIKAIRKYPSIVFEDFISLRRAIGNFGKRRELY